MEDSLLLGRLELLMMMMMMMVNCFITKKLPGVGRLELLVKTLIFGVKI